MGDLQEVVGMPAADERSAPHLAAREAGPFELRVGAADRADRHTEFVGKVAMRRQAITDA